MNSHFIVCPFKEAIINQICRRALVLRVNSTDEIPKIIQYQQTNQFHIHCIWVQTKNPLSSINLLEEWRDIPIALYTPGLGGFKDFIKKLPVIKQLNIRIYVPIDSKEKYAVLRILSSLGISSGVLFTESYLDWELISDLMTYSFLGLVPHAPIEPFHYIASYYAPNHHTNFSSVYFEDPTKYIHLDESGHVGLSQKDLKDKNFIPIKIDDIDNIDQNNEYIKIIESWREFFLQADGCAYCQGWRVCLGRFSNTKDKFPGCTNFFIELIDTIEQYQSLKNKKEKVIWQP